MLCMIMTCDQQSTETLTDLMDKVSRTVKHAVEVEEKIPLDQVTNYNEVILHHMMSSLDY